MATTSPTNPMMDIVQAQLEASRQLANAVFTGTEKLDRMMIDVTQRVFNEQMRITQAAIQVRDAGQMAELQTGFMSRPDAISGYQKEVLDVLAQMQSEIGESMQQYMQQMAARAESIASTMTAPDAAFGGAGGMGDGSANPMAGMLSVWQSAFRDAAALASRNMEAARANLAQAMATGAAAASASGDDEKAGGGARRK